MMALKFGLYGILHALLLVTLSFFVWILADKLKKGPIKTFGNIIVLLLWAFAAITLITTLVSTSFPMKMDGRRGRSMSPKRHMMMKK